MEIILDPNPQEAMDDVARLLEIVAKVVEPCDNLQEVILFNSQANALAIFVDSIKTAISTIKFDK